MQTAILAGIVTAFTIFALALAWADYTTGRKGSGQ